MACENLSRVRLGLPSSFGLSEEPQRLKSLHSSHSVKTSVQVRNSGKIEEKPKNGLEDCSYFCFAVFICNRHKPLLFSVFLFLLYLFYMFRLGQVKNGLKPKNRWVQNSVKANRTRVWTQISLSLSLSLFTLCLRASTEMPLV